MTDVERSHFADHTGMMIGTTGAHIIIITMQIMMILEDILYGIHQAEETKVLATLARPLWAVDEQSRCLIIGRVGAIVPDHQHTPLIPDQDLLKCAIVEAVLMILEMIAPCSLKTAREPDTGDQHIVAIKQ